MTTTDTRRADLDTIARPAPPGGDQTPRRAEQDSTSIVPPHGAGTDTRRAEAESSPIRPPLGGHQTPRCATTLATPGDAPRGEDRTARAANAEPQPQAESPRGPRSPRRARGDSATVVPARGEDQTPRPAVDAPTPERPTPGGPNTPVDPSASDARTSSVDGGTATRPAGEVATADVQAPGGSDSLADRKSNDAHGEPVGEGHDNRTGRTGSDSRGYFAGAVQDSGTGHLKGDAHCHPAGAARTRPAGAMTFEVPASPAPRLGDVNGGGKPPRAPRVATGPDPDDEWPGLEDHTLNVAAALVDDIERTRIAAEHRLRILTRPIDEADEDGKFRGHGIPAEHPTPRSLAALIEALAGVEHQAVLELQRAMRRHPLGPWVKGAKGIGEKQGARLLAAVGDPYWNARDQRPRTVSQLWAYCGLHTLPADRGTDDAHSRSVGGGKTGDPGHRRSDAPMVDARVAARRRKGERANWSTTAKTRAYLVAVSCMKSPGSPYRDLYLSRREHTAMTHPEWTAGHSHNDALRIVAKRVLRDAWRAARDIHADHEGVPA